MRQQFKQPIKRSVVIPGPENNIWFWNPNLIGVKFADERFMQQLHQVGEELSCTWNPIKQRWTVWSVAPLLKHKICHGWRLLFLVEDANGDYLPLDERVFARLYAASVMAHGSAKQYFDRIVAEQARDKERREKQQLQDQIDMSMPYWEHSQIKNIGKGNKFATYHS